MTVTDLKILQNRNKTSLLYPLLLFTFAALWQTPAFPQARGDSAAGGPPLPHEVLRIMTYNIRYDNPDDGPFAWTNRRLDVVSFVRSQQLDIFCIQEGLERQVAFLKGGLRGFEFRGVGRDDGKDKGEFSAIYFNRARFRCLKSGTFWLSPHPDRPGRGWDAALPRIVTWVRLRDSATGKTFFVFNTHFDHEGIQARENSARLLRVQISAIAGNAPVILTGDFNADESDPPHAILMSSEGSSSGLVDAFDSSIMPHTGPRSTFSGFEGKEAEQGNRIDWILVSQGVRVVSHATLTPRFTFGYLSDHHPVFAEVELP